MRRTLVTLALVAGALAPATGASAGPAPAIQSGSVSVRLGDAPTDRRNDPRARLYIVDYLKLGRTISRRIEIGNGTGQRQHAAVYAAAAGIHKGAFTGAAGHTGNELSTWTSLDRATVDLPPGSVETVRVTIRVPKDASPGERYAIIWAEVRGPTPKGGGVTLINRVGIRIYLSVGAGGEPASDFAITALTAERLPNGQPIVLATVKNTGGRALDMSGQLKLSAGPGGLTAGPFAAKLGSTLAVADAEQITVPLDTRLPDGPWLARVDLKSGLVARSAQATITFPKAGRAAPVKAQPVSTGLSPWLIGIAVLGLLLLGLLLWLIARRRGRRRRATEAAQASQLHAKAH